MKKHVFCSILCCMMVFALSTVHAAPVRDGDTGVVALSAQAHRMIDLVLSAAVARDTRSLNEGETVPQALDEALFALCAFTESEREQVTYTESECDALHSTFFLSAFVMPDSSDCACVSIENGRMTLDLTPLYEMPLYGAFVYGTEPDGQRLTVYADVFSAYGYFGYDAEDIPEEALTWYSGARILLMQDLESPYGWKVVSYSLTDIYQGGDLSGWRSVSDAVSGLSFSVPAFLLARSSDNGFSFSSPDGSYVLNVVKRETGGSSTEDLMAAFWDEAPDMILEIGAREGTFEATGEGRYVFCLNNEKAQAAFYMDFVFPVDRHEECMLYANLIRNTFILEALSFG